MCVKIGDYAMAIRFYREALEQRPGDYEARFGLGKALLQKAVHAGGDTVGWRQALIQLEAARNIHPTREVNKVLSGAWSYYGRTRMNWAQDYRDSIAALRHLSRAIDYDGDNVEAVNLAGIAYYHLGDTEKAAKLFQKAIEIDSTLPAGYFNAGMLYWQRDEVAQAHRYWLYALKHAPDDRDILYWFARAEKSMRKENAR